MGRNRRIKRKLKERTTSTLTMDSKTICYDCGAPAVFQGKDQKWRCPSCQTKHKEASFGVVRVSAGRSLAE